MQTQNSISAQAPKGASTSKQQEMSIENSPRAKSPSLADRFYCTCLQLLCQGWNLDEKLPDGVDAKLQVSSMH